MWATYQAFEHDLVMYSTSRETDKVAYILPSSSGNKDALLTHHVLLKSWPGCLITAGSLALAWHWVCGFGLSPICSLIEDHTWSKARRYMVTLAYNGHGPCTCRLTFKYRGKLHIPYASEETLFGNIVVGCCSEKCTSVHVCTISQTYRRSHDSCIAHTNCLVWLAAHIHACQDLDNHFLDIMITWTSDSTKSRNLACSAGQTCESNKV